MTTDPTASMFIRLLAVFSCAMSIGFISALFVRKMRQSGVLSLGDRFVAALCVAYFVEIVSDLLLIGDRVYHGLPVVWYGAPMVIVSNGLIIWAFLSHRGVW
jgi:hypothetical protein